ncbi:MAG TPA: LEA type 2 family protein [Planctomycetota bacterium]|nr:LEA type 2 family protein [Planctomycetota bacterium]
MTNLPRLPLLLLLALFPLCSCAEINDLVGSMNKPGVKVAGMDLAGLSLDGVDLNFDLDVSNPYSVPLPVAGLDYALKSGGAPFLNGNSTYQGLIPAGSVQRIPLSARVGFTEALRLLQGIKPGAIVPYDAELGVSVDAPGIGPLRLPVESSGSFPIPTIPTVSIDQVRWETLGLSEAKGVIGLKVGNGNSFPLDLDRLSYSLDLAGLSVASTSLTKALSLKPENSGILEIPVSLRPMDLGMAALSLLSKGDASWSLRGTMDTLTPFGALSLPVGGTGRTPMVR